MITPSHARTFLVVPFQRVGNYIGPHQIMIVENLKSARVLADRLSSKVPGVAIIERGQNEETGEDIDKVIAASGAVPEEISGAGNWTMPLH